MAMKKRRKISDWEEGVRLLELCPLCEAPYEPLEIKILAEQERLHLLHVTCRECHHAVAALITREPGGVSSLGVVTDAQPEDIDRWRSAAPISWDDCLAWHDFLKEDQKCKETFFS